MLKAIITRVLLSMESIAGSVPRNGKTVQYTKATGRTANSMDLGFISRQRGTRTSLGITSKIRWKDLVKWNGLMVESTEAFGKMT